MEEKVLQKYLEKLLQIQARPTHFGEQDFRIALSELNLTAEEQKALAQEFEQRFKLGSNYYQAKNYDKAIEQLETAKAIEPYHLACHLLLTDAYKLRYLAEHKPADYERSLALCQEGLRLQSHNPFFSGVETAIEKYQQGRHQLRWAMLGLFPLAGLLLAGLYFGAQANLSSSALLAMTLGFSLFIAAFSASFYWHYAKRKKALKRERISLKFVVKK